MPINMLPSLRILRRPEQQYMVQFGIAMQDTDQRGNLYMGAPAMVYGAGVVYHLDLHTLQTPIAGTIPPFRTLQFTATMFYTGASPNIREFYIFNPTTSQCITVLMPPALGTSPSVINACVPFALDSSAELDVFWKVGSSSAVPTETSINLNACLYTHEVSSYWNESTVAIALQTGAVIPHETAPQFSTIKGGHMQQHDLLALEN